MEYTDEFETFWLKYPSRWNPHQSCYVKRKKCPAFEKWRKLKPEIRKECLAKVHLIKKTEGSASSVRDCVTWLNQAGWDDIKLDKPKSFVSHTMADSIFEPVCKAPIDVNSRRNEQRKGLEK